MREFFNSKYPYLFGTVEMLTEYYFFYSFLDRKVSLVYLLLFGFAGIIVTALCPAGGILEFIVYIPDRPHDAAGHGVRV